MATTALAGAGGRGASVEPRGGVVTTTSGGCMVAFWPPVAARAVEENDLRVGNSNSTGLESSTVEFRD